VSAVEDGYDVVPGRYDFPDLLLGVSMNYEVEVVLGDYHGFYNAEDLAEAVQRVMRGVAGTVPPGTDVRDLPPGLLADAVAALAAESGAAEDDGTPGGES
jgi:hypothetical protein